MAHRLLLLVISLLASAPATAQHLVAHRGASHDAPENTLAAFRLAWEQGADGIEGDFHLTADGQIVCLHDYDTQRVAGRKLVVKDATLEELRALDVGAWKDERFRGERTPTFAEVAATVPAGKLLFVEVKCGPEIVPTLADALATARDEVGLAAEQIVIISFHEDVIAACRKRLPTYQTQWLTGYKEKAGRWTPTADSVAATLTGCGAGALGCQAERRYFDDRFVADLRDRGASQGADFRFGVWTVDDPEAARYYRDLGAWSITTNRPGWLRQRLAD
ncbi:putative glycerophosphoryl diester phosphodiesterase 1 [Botrimarina colliarenosi]|uniref:Putative glycerophosphoryl diester phosphodiesterase 1 n=1 Tax=Botrimarina colliarenosi TaxID=2528001 RepID=A0A5C6A839_9BACT|nr:glycerophosphodiester phosphodiesterase [Botrimarina colliarenosi]TWT95191.1 putative glycerophosphoryl diester phosphodiesterase 1 [Botrimarina colliarenosi]